MTKPLSPWQCLQFRDLEGREGFVAYLEGLTRDGIHGIECDRIEHVEAPGCWFRAPENLVGAMATCAQLLGGQSLAIERDVP